MEGGARGGVWWGIQGHGKRHPLGVSVVVALWLLFRLHPTEGASQKKEIERRDNPDAVFGETWLFFGCRHKEQDYLFREELEGFVSSGTLTHLKPCFSRDDDDDDADDAVTAETEPPAVSLPSPSPPADAKNMARDVNDTLLAMVRAELQIDQLDALKTLASLREEKRYLQDIWG
ncbi:hypothetical protein CRUP_018553 [Coryphaenoides rupestris]|nr:hypothetical protein CRUP_018553 [Coryphaenoides rupestris]